jgi:hypothetical protein
MTPDYVTVTEIRDGVRIIVDHKESDTLAVIEVKHSTTLHKIMAKVGLRGNFSMKGNRGMRYVYTNIDAPPVSEPERLRRKATAIERGGYAAKDDPVVEWFA